MFDSTIKISGLGVTDVISDAEMYLIEAFSRVDLLLKNHTLSQALRLVVDQGRSESDFNKLMLAFQKTRSRPGDGYVTYYSLADYYKYRYSRFMDSLGRRRVCKNDLADKKDEFGSKYKAKNSWI